MALLDIGHRSAAGLDDSRKSFMWPRAGRGAVDILLGHVLGELLALENAVVVNRLAVSLGMKS